MSRRFSWNPHQVIQLPLASMSWRMWLARILNIKGITNHNNWQYQARQISLLWAWSHYMQVKISMTMGGVVFTWRYSDFLWDISWWDPAPRANQQLVKRVRYKIKPRDPIFLMNILFRRMILRVSKKFNTHKETDLASGLDVSVVEGLRVGVGVVDVQYG